MTRVAVIGNAGGGKSTLCRRLSQALAIELYPIDQIQWKPGWIPASYEEVKQRHDEILTHARWIIDGWGPLDLIVERFEAADTIILVDQPLYIHYWWVMKRQVRCIFQPRPDGPACCPLLPMTWPLLKMIWHIHHHARPGLLELVNSYGDRKQLFHIQSPQDLRQFIKRHCSQDENFARPLKRG